MGNCCGKPDPDVFATPGRRLDSAPGPARGTIPGAPAHKPPKSQPAPAPRTVGGPAHTLGGGSWTSGGAAEDARRKAAAAAEARARSSSGGSKKPAGKLGVQLAAQKKQTRAETLREASAVERLQREADANAGALRND